MAIQRKFAGGGSGILAGEHIVKVMEVKTSMTKEKPDKPSRAMYVVTFQNKEGQKHTGYYVKAVPFMMKQFTELKKCCGVKETDAADELVGKKCGILLEPGEPNDEGKIFMQIAGYGTEADVLGNSAAAPTQAVSTPASDNFGESDEISGIPF